MLEWIISSSVLIIILILLRFALRGKISLRLQYALWALALVRLLFPYSIGAVYWSAAGTAKVFEPIANVVSVAELALPLNERYEFDSIEEYTAFAEANRSVDITGNKNPEFKYFSSGEGYVRADVPITVSWITVLKTIWICGIAIISSWFIFSNLRLLYNLKKNRTLLKNSGNLPVYLSDSVETPCLFGLFCPAVYLTSEAASDETVVRHAVEHELTHYGHKDHIWAVLRCVCLAVHWYNPLVWYAAILSRNDAELACDETTIRRLGEDARAAYGRTLIGLTCEKRTALFNTATTMTSNSKNIKERISLIVKNPRTAIYSLVIVILVSVIAVGCTFTGTKEQPDYAVSETDTEVINVALREDAVPFSCADLIIAIPNEYMDEVTVENGEDIEDKDTLISVYWNGMQDKESGWLFSLKRYDQTQYEQHLAEGVSGEAIFAKDEEWYYCYAKYAFPFGLGGNSEEGQRWKFLHAQLGLEVLGDFIARNEVELFDDPTASLDPRDYPARTERLSVMAENKEIWIHMSDDSGQNGHIVLTVYTQESGEFIQNISYGVGLTSKITLLTMIQEPSRFVSLMDINGDGSDDIRVLIGNLHSEEQATYRDFIWDEDARQFVEKN